MKRENKIVLHFDRFFQDFLYPLVMGGEIVIWKPIPYYVIEEFVNYEPTSSEKFINFTFERMRLSSEILLQPLDMKLTEDDILIGGALYNYLCVIHPDTEKITRKGVKETSKIWGDILYRKVCNISLTPTVLVRRHTLLRSFINVKRVDVEFKGRWRKKSYKGISPHTKKELLQRKGKREVKEKVVTITSELSKVGGVPLIEFFNTVSPFTVLWWGSSEIPLRLNLSFMEVFTTKWLLRALLYHHLSLTEPIEVVKWFLGDIELKLKEIDKIEKELLKVVYLAICYLVHLVESLWIVDREKLSSYINRKEFSIIVSALKNGIRSDEAALELLNGYDTDKLRKEFEYYSNLIQLLIEKISY